MIFLRTKQDIGIIKENTIFTILLVGNNYYKIQSDKCTIEINSAELDKYFSLVTDKIGGLSNADI